MNPPLNLHVHAIRYEAQGIVGVELHDVDGKTLPEYASGVHIELRLDSGLVCSYSLYGAPEVCDRYVVGVLLDHNSRGGPRYVHEQLRVGSTLEVDGPRNHFEVDETASYTVLVAGGIGVTPIVCMTRRPTEQGKAFSMLYYAHSHTDAAFADKLTGRGDAVRLRLNMGAGGPPDLKALPARHSTDTHFHCCGLGPMLRTFEATCGALDYTNVHVERFATDPDVESAQDDGYQVRLTRNGTELRVSADRPLLDALLEIGVEVEYSCKEGVCGSCEIHVLEREPDHRDSVFLKSRRAPNQTTMVCVSGCEGRRLVVDL